MSVCLVDPGNPRNGYIELYFKKVNNICYILSLNLTSETINVPNNKTP